MWYGADVEHHFQMTDSKIPCRYHNIPVIYLFTNDLSLTNIGSVLILVCLECQRQCRSLADQELFKKDISSWLSGRHMDKSAHTYFTLLEMVHKKANKTNLMLAEKPHLVTVISTISLIQTQTSEITPFRQVVHKYWQC